MSFLLLLLTKLLTKTAFLSALCRSTSLFEFSILFICFPLFSFDDSCFSVSFWNSSLSLIFSPLNKFKDVARDWYRWLNLFIAGNIVDVRFRWTHMWDDLTLAKQNSVVRLKLGYSKLQKKKKSKKKTICSYTKHLN